MPIRHTARGFADYAEFTDTYGHKVVVRESSSAMQSCVWVFVSGGLQSMMPIPANPEVGHPDVTIWNGEPMVSPRRLWVDDKGKVSASHNHQAHESLKKLSLDKALHLNKEQAVQLRDALTEWIDNQS